MHASIARRRRVLAALVASGLGGSAPPLVAAAGSPPQSAPMNAAECEVWTRELGFAHALAAHDAVAFAGFVHAGAVFGAGSASPTRGRDAIVADWKDLIAGKDLILRWHPGHVAIGADPAIALSSGPAWTDDRGAGTGPRYTISRYTSTWVRDRDGQWRVLFDGAGSDPKAASAAEVAALAAAQPASCPRG
jgi:ketosteroid isomerase-like protein